VPLVVAYDEHERVWNVPVPLLFQRRFGAESRPIPALAIRELINIAVARGAITDTDGRALRFAPHDFRRIFVTDAIMHGMPPHIAQLVVGHKNINTTMGYKAVYPEEVITGHRAFIARRRALRPGEEYRTPTDEEWEDFLGHFERRKVALGTCGRSYATPCVHEHSCLRCPLLRPDPAQRPRLVEIHDNLVARIGEARREGWSGEVEGAEGQPRRSQAETRPDRRDHRPPQRRRAPGHARLPRRRRPHRHRHHRPSQPGQGALMTPPAVTTDLLHDLVAGSHAEGVIAMAVASTVDHDGRVLLIVQPGLDFIDDTWQLPAGPVLPGETLADPRHSRPEHRGGHRLPRPPRP